MNSTQLKAFFRQFFKVITGGPVSGPAGKTRSSGILLSLDKLVDESERAFVPLLGSELPSDRQAFAGLALRPLLVQLANAAGGVVTPSAPGQVGTVTPTPGVNQLGLAFPLVPSATSYTAKYRSAGSGAYITGTSGSGSPLVITGLTASAYNFTVTASNNAGAGLASAPVTATPAVANNGKKRLRTLGDSRRQQGNSTPGSLSVLYYVQQENAGNANIEVMPATFAEGGWGLTVSYNNPSWLDVWDTVVKPVLQQDVADGYTTTLEIQAFINIMAVRIEQGALTNQQIIDECLYGASEVSARAHALGVRTMITTPWAAAPHNAWTDAMRARLEACRLAVRQELLGRAEVEYGARSVADVGSHYRVDSSTDVALDAVNNPTSDGVHFADPDRALIEGPVVKAAFDFDISGTFGIATGPSAPVGPTQQAWLYSDPAPAVSFAGTGGTVGANYAYVKSSILSNSTFTGSVFSVGYGAYPDAFPLYDVYCNGVFVGSIDDARTSSGGISEKTKTFAMAAGTKVGWEIRPVAASGGLALDSNGNPPTHYFYRASAS